MENEIVKELEEKVLEINKLFRKIHDSGLNLEVKLLEVDEYTSYDSIKSLLVKVTKTIYSNKYG
jgi:hypothetical protein